MTKSTTLSAGTINQSGAQLLIELVEPADHPAVGSYRLAQPTQHRAAVQVQRGSRGNHATAGIRRHRVQPAQGSTAVTDPADSLLAIHTRAGRACRCRKARTSRSRTS
jgi:hypothetical protein